MKKQKGVSYAKWGYVFILPFFVSFFIFSLIPLVDTIRYSFYEYYRSGIKEIGPNFVGLKNYISLLQSDMLTYGKNTVILWIIGFIPQILTNGQGSPDRTSFTLIMFLNSHLKSKNYGMAGALSVYLFIVSGILCFITYRITNDNDPDGSKAAAKKRAKEARRAKRAQK